MNTTSLSSDLLRNNTPWYARQVIHLLQEIEHGCLHLELPNGMNSRSATARRMPI
jgi:hypothetical protein